MTTLLQNVPTYSAQHSVTVHYHTQRLFSRVCHAGTPPEGGAIVQLNVHVVLGVRPMSCVAPETSLLESGRGQRPSNTFQVNTSCSVTGPEVDLA